MEQPKTSRIITRVAGDTFPEAARRAIEILDQMIALGIEELEDIALTFDEAATADVVVATAYQINTI